MPIYAYRCEVCGFAKDVLQKMSDAQLTECPSCGKSSFKKQVTAASFQLKGSGWYVTDFRGGDKGAGAGASASASASAESTSATASDSGATATAAATPAPAPATAATPAAAVTAAPFGASAGSKASASVEK
ncbi:MAG: FmdB family zinc ribbon protein [Burkholderiaceae bacterium]